ncbi:MAG TPA: DUF1080 domain-containing protein [Chthoniobacteraceae bacterium]|jgi:hypothetical protein|nr:DUF1080 domain-containing protein [Chthoniobacteraceae bacterium]
MNFRHLLVSLLLLTASAFAVDVPEGFTDLLASRDLAGWQEPTVAAEHWKVEGGELINDGKGTDLATAKSYRNFELRLEWKIPLKGDSGVFLPGGQQVQIWAKESGSGGFVFDHKYSVSPTVVADKPLGEWNAFLIRLIDGKVTVTLNGKVVMQDVPVEKGVVPPLRGPEEGPLRLQKSPHNVMTTFRNVFIRAL